MIDIRELMVTVVSLCVGVVATAYIMTDQTYQAIKDRATAEDRLVSLELNQTFASDQLRECKNTLENKDRKIAEYYSELHRRRR